MRELVGLLVKATSQHWGFDLGLGFGQSQLTQTNNPKQVEVGM